MRPTRWVLILGFSLLVQQTAAGESLAVSLLGVDEPLEAPLREALGGHDIALAEPDASDLLVVSGSEALHRGLALERPLVALNVPRAELLEAWRDGCSCTGLFAEVDPALQLRLIDELFPAANRVGVLVGPETGWLRGYLPGYASRAGVELVVREAGSRQELGRALAWLLPRVDVLLGVTDTELYNAETARQILLTGYRQNRPVVGPDASFVTAGSIASVVYFPGDLAVEVADMVGAFARTGRLPSPAYPSHYGVEINERVAETFELPLEDFRTLPRRLERRP